MWLHDFSLNLATTATPLEGISLQQGIPCISLNCPRPCPHPAKLRLLKQHLQGDLILYTPCTLHITEIRQAARQASVCSYSSV